MIVRDTIAVNDSSEVADSLAVSDSLELMDSTPKAKPVISDTLLKKIQELKGDKGRLKLDTSKTQVNSQDRPRQLVRPQRPVSNKED